MMGPSPAGDSRAETADHGPSRLVAVKGVRIPADQDATSRANGPSAQTSQLPYAPQFSATTSLILDRIRGGTQDFSSALSDASATLPRPSGHAYQDARTRLVQSMSTSLEMAQPPPPTTTTEPEEKAAAGIKRKREESETVDFTQNTMVMPPVAAPRPRPPLPASSAPRRAEADPHHLKRIEKIRQKRLASLPEGVAPARQDLVGFGPGAASDYARAEYFSSMKRTDVLNLLSFCDQLKPRLLVDVMVSVTKRHPDLPIFDSPDWDAPFTTEQPRSASGGSRRPPGRPRHGPSLLNSKARHKVRSTGAAAASSSSSSKHHHPGRKPLKRSRLAEEVVVKGGDGERAGREDGGDVNEQEEEEDVDEDGGGGGGGIPPTWPKAGEGLYAKLRPETEDQAFLADGNDEEAFSHFMVDGVGRQIVDPV